MADKVFIGVLAAIMLAFGLAVIAWLVVAIVPALCDLGMDYGWWNCHV